MSIRRQDGGKADVSADKQDVLAAVEAVYLQRYPKHAKRLIVVHLRRGHSWPYQRIASGLQISKVHAWRMHHETESRLKAIGQEIFSSVPFLADADRIFEEN